MIASVHVSPMRRRTGWCSRDPYVGLLSLNPSGSSGYRTRGQRATFTGVQPGLPVRPYGDDGRSAANMRSIRPAARPPLSAGFPPKTCWPQRQHCRCDRAGSRVPPTPDTRRGITGQIRRPSDRPRLPRVRLADLVVRVTVRSVPRISRLRRCGPSASAMDIDADGRECWLSWTGTPAVTATIPPPFQLSTAEQREGPDRCSLWTSMANGSPSAELRGDKAAPLTTG